MQDQRTADLIARVLLFAEALEPGEGRPFGPILIVRTKSGTLRCAGWNGFVASWWRGEFAEVVSDSLWGFLDWQQGYFASKCRRDIADQLECDPFLIAGVGRRNPRFMPKGAAA